MGYTFIGKHDKEDGRGHRIILVVLFFVVVVFFHDRLVIEEMKILRLSEWGI